MTSASDGNDGGADAVNLEQNTGHDREGLALLLQQFRDKPRMESVTSSMMTQIQDLEDALFTLLLERFISDATVGIQLDGIGQIVGRPRAGLSDDDYRALLRAVVRSNKSNGTGNELIEIVELLLNAPDDYALADITIEELFPAHVVVRLEEQLTFDVNIVIEVLRTSKAAGVRLILEYILSLDADVFHTSSVVGVSEFGDTAQGFGSQFTATGGRLAGAIE